MADPFVGGKVRDASLRGLGEALKALPKELASKRGGPLSRALGQGANVLVEAIEERAPVDEGTLRDSVRQKRDPNPQDVTERRIVYVSRRAWWAMFVEFGTVKQQAQPFVRPAFEAKKYDVLARIVEALKKGIENAAKRAARLGLRIGRG